MYHRIDLPTRRHAQPRHTGSDREVDPFGVGHGGRRRHRAGPARGRAQWQVFDAGLATRSAERLSLTTERREALDRDQLQLHYQPVIDLRTGVLVGLDALLRWEHPLRGSVPLSTFVSLAEHTGVGATLDRWVLFRACRDAALLRESGAMPPSAHLAVNVSARSLNDPALVAVVRMRPWRLGFRWCRWRSKSPRPI